ncbi:MAG: hypothetical protein WAT39_13425 [Planctomycetota bacterium]
MTDPAHLQWVWRELAALRTEGELRGYLRAGLTTREREYVGFHDLSIEQCIDGVIAAAPAERQHPDDRAAHEALVDALDLYLATMRQAAFRRQAGAAPCLPDIR